MKVRIFCRIYPTENPKKIRDAVLKIFPDAKVRISENYLVAETSSIENFASLLRKQRIRDSARSVLTEGMDENSISFRLNKQVMTVGRINFAVEDMPLGDVEVRVEAEGEEDIREILDQIAPSTRVEGEEKEKRESHSEHRLGSHRDYT